jgi:hypothetical protein
MRQLDLASDVPSAVWERSAVGPKSWAGQIACAMMIARSTHVARAVSVTLVYRIISVHVFNRNPTGPP